MGEIQEDKKKTCSGILAPFLLISSVFFHKLSGSCSSQNAGHLTTWCSGNGILRTVFAEGSGGMNKYGDEKGTLDISVGYRGLLSLCDGGCELSPQSLVLMVLQLERLHFKEQGNSSSN